MADPRPNVGLSPARSGATLQRRWDLFVTLLQRQYRIRRQRSLLGFVWPVVAPLVLLSLYTFVFTDVFDVPVPNYRSYLFLGLIPWAFLTTSLNAALPSVSVEAELLRRVRFPIELLPISTVTVNFVSLLILVGSFTVWHALTGGVELVLLPLLVLPLGSLLLLVSSGALLLSIIDVYNRDLRFVLNNILTVWFFLIPIVYRPDMVSPGLQALRSVDPMNMIVGQMRDLLYFGQFSRPLNSALMIAVCVGCFGVSLHLFRRVAPVLPRDV
jgi:ABC-2 type transport system permease protein